MSWLDSYLADLTSDGPGDPKVPKVRPDATAARPRPRPAPQVDLPLPPIDSIGATPYHSPDVYRHPQFPDYDPSTPRRPDPFAQLITGQGPLAPQGAMGFLADLTPGLGQLRGISSGSQAIAQGSGGLGALAVIGSMLPGGEGAEARAAEEAVASREARSVTGSSRSLQRILGGDRAKVTPAMEALRDAPAAIKKRIEAARELVNAPVPADRPQPLGFIDRSLISPDEGPTNTPLPDREPFGPRQAAGHMANGIDTPTNRALVTAQVQRGMRMMPNTFYPSHSAVYDAIGQAGGDPELFTKAATGAAIRNGVVGELVGGSAMQYALKRGVITPEQLAQTAALTSGRRQAWEDVAQSIRDLWARDFPQAKGLQLMGVHPQAFNALLQGPEADAYKIPWYYRQKKGDVPGFVLDTHESKGGTLTSPFHRLFADQGGFATQGEYGAQERFYRSIAQDLGLSDRSMQEARWRGGGNITGLRSVPNADYGTIFEHLIQQNAQLRGLDSKQLLGQVARGENVLFLP